MDRTKITVSKFEAAQRQLDTAIQLWFYDADAVSVHTLAAAAYNITHDIKRHRGIARDLLYDAALIKDEYRKQWISAMKKQQNFFKHADNDPDPKGTIELHALGNLLFIMIGVAGLQLLGVKPSFQASALFLWLTLHDPSLIKADYLKGFNESAQRLGIDNFEDVRAVPKADFFDEYMKISQDRGRAN
jgi:hypothetical protein